MTGHTIGPFGPYVRVLARLPKERSKYGTDHVVQVREGDVWQDLETFNDMDDDYALTHACTRAIKARQHIREGEKP